ncbi:serine hydrolase domain-containing protein [Shimazuella alba]|uniref:Serine hydrolase n=1 Tax=Shimazuella alba TaxID=2690964 RepID=A0A6I4VTG1_9BACL|nr:serine hydrolase domain-containing protein [Shimazuella alba]MXQ54303.1 serine hydrolase [Shimazuella alba]
MTSKNNSPLQKEIFDNDYWQNRLDSLCKEYKVPGASLAVLKDKKIYKFASGVLNHDTGVEVTTDSLFQIGSMSKVYTATLIMQLVDAGLLHLNDTLKDLLPELTIPFAESITIRHLLTHNSGLTSDGFFDSGRGDDCLAKYVDLCKEQNVSDSPPSQLVSYSNLGYNLLGRIIEVLTHQIWDEALIERLFIPLGLTHTVTLPEEVLKFRAAMGHIGLKGQDPEPTPFWNVLPRAAGPSGAAICATAEDIVRMAHMHLNEGKDLNGNQILQRQTTTDMQQLAVKVPDPWSYGNQGFGLGWMIYDWDGISVIGHDGGTLGQNAYLRFIPQFNIAVALLTNGGSTDLLYMALYRELFSKWIDVQIPNLSLKRPSQSPSVDITPLLGKYQRVGTVLTLSERNGKLWMHYEHGMGAFYQPVEMELVPISENVFIGISSAESFFGEAPVPVVFISFADGTIYCHIGMRATPKIA